MASAVPAAEPVAPTVICRLGSTLLYAATQDLNSGRIKVDPVSETVSVACATANDNMAPAAVNATARLLPAMLVRRLLMGLSSAWRPADIQHRRWANERVRTTLTEVMLR